MAGQAFHAGEKLAREVEIRLLKNLLLGVIRVAGRKTKRVFQDKLESGAGRFRNMQKDDHQINAGIIGRLAANVNPDFPGENKTFTFRRRCQNIGND
jgi:hypothetical protein